ncbi:hypothetical protein [Aureimonas endophytica]|nr:hypothetical protein [Aureimonas endophytica]
MQHIPYYKKSIAPMLAPSPAAGMITAFMASTIIWLGALVVLRA